MISLDKALVECNKWKEWKLQTQFYMRGFVFTYARWSIDFIQIQTLFHWGMHLN